MNTDTTNELKCDGACEEHTGPPRMVTVKGWGEFCYCETAIAEDRRRGFVVTEESDNL